MLCLGVRVNSEVFSKKTKKNIRRASSPPAKQTTTQSIGKQNIHEDVKNLNYRQLRFLTNYESFVSYFVDSLKICYVFLGGSAARGAMPARRCPGRERAWQENHLGFANFW